MSPAELQELVQATQAAAHRQSLLNDRAADDDISEEEQQGHQRHDHQRQHEQFSGEKHHTVQQGAEGDELDDSSGVLEGLLNQVRQQLGNMQQHRQGGQHQGTAMQHTAAGRASTLGVPGNLEDLTQTDAESSIGEQAEGHSMLETATSSGVLPRPNPTRSLFEVSRALDAAAAVVAGMSTEPNSQHATADNDIDADLEAALREFEAAVAGSSAAGSDDPSHHDNAYGAVVDNTRSGLGNSWSRATRSGDEADLESQLDYHSMSSED